MIGHRAALESRRQPVATRQFIAESHRTLKNLVYARK